MADAVFTPVTPADGTFSAAGSAAWAAGMTGPIVEANITLADNTTNDVSATKHGFAPKFPNNTTTFLRGDGTYAVPAGGAALSGITAAAAGNTIASGNNHSQRWNWALTSNSVNAMEFGETTAATNGTSTSGVPNQYIAKFSTVAASTASPWGVYSRATFVAAVSPTTAQMLFAIGDQTAPSIAAAAGTNTGIGFQTASLVLTTAGTARLNVTNTYLENKVKMYAVNGSAASDNQGIGGPSGNHGFFFPSAVIGVSISAVENSRWEAGLFQASKGTADTVSYALNFRKSRGTVASPTVITTGDDLATISGFGYVGATGTYVEAATIRFDSTGTIADNSTGVGGIIRFETRAVGGAMTEALSIQGGTVPQLQAASGAFGNPAYSFAGNVAMGLYRATNNLNMVFGSTTGSFSVLNSSGSTKLQVDAAGPKTIDGSAGAPSFGSINDVDTGLYFSADLVGVSTAGTARVTIDNNATAAETSILVSINGGAPVRVSKGANDSGGAGYAVLRIPN